MLSIDVLIICFLSSYIACDTELFDKRTISLFLYFPYKCIHSSFEIHSVFVTVTVATCTVYNALRAFQAFIVNAITKTCQKSYRQC